MIIITIYRKDKCIQIAGYEYLMLLIFSTIFLNISLNYWIGKISKIKCLVKEWLIITGIHGFICSYSIKIKTINWIYNNKDVTKLRKKDRIVLRHLLLTACQYLILVIHSFSHHSLGKVQKKIEDVGYYDYAVCPRCNKLLISLIFLIDYIIVALTIISAYQGRNVPNQFNFNAIFQIHM